MAYERLLIKKTITQFSPLMDNLSFHITDITANSIRAKASDIEIDIQIKDTSICIRIADNGCGMDLGNSLSDP